MQTQQSCPPPYSFCYGDSCDCDKEPAQNVICDQLTEAQSAMRIQSVKHKRGPSLANIYMPFSFLKKGQGLADIKTDSGPVSKLPTTWSWKKDGGSKISPVPDQFQCGCCWAVASTTALADRFGVKGTNEFPDGIEAPNLSSAWTVMAIGPQHGGPSVECQCSIGGSLGQAGCGFEEIGARLESCYPFSLYVCQGYAQEPAVLSKEKAQYCCSSSEKSMAFKIKPGSTQMVVAYDENGNIDEKATHMRLKVEIIKNGPIPATFLEYSDFQQNYDSYYNTSVIPAQSWEDVGVYVPKPSYGKEVPGGHAVVITGWGVKDGKEFWEVRNSWGVKGQGGGKGYFKYAIIENDTCHLAAPAIVDINGQKSIAGGAVSFLPGDIPDGFIPKPGSGKRRSPDNYGNFGNDSPEDFIKKFIHFKNQDGSLNWPFILILVLFAAIIIALIVPSRSKNKK
jgi:hypothetical protein